jgi:hypothetical protein
MTDFNEIERRRWGGPSPTAGMDTRTDAQRNPRLNHGTFERHGDSVIAEIHTAVGLTIHLVGSEDVPMIPGGRASVMTLAIVGSRGGIQGVVALDKARRQDLIDTLQAMG